ncbi:carbohydrate-binding domain-containing protein [Salinibacterium sp. NG253]|uniref:carbohydrate-binding domain-containing protein n=1 Tax=Salinibacterium sp. NG253 TaxID=2792039 RepID=UPI0018CD6295|nr:carbohydrate-binding domain-containing protein [Salinibacterium sp. NG253]MBH0117446.1 carbohydrate-binding domain-containing protein [Salinibacterium sp. NG253]
MRKSKLVAASLSTIVLTVVLAGCSATAFSDTAAETAAVGALGFDATQNAEQIMAANDTEPTASTDFDYNVAQAVSIALQGSTAIASGAGALIEGSTITITTAGTYVLGGTLDDGQIVVDTADEGIVRLVLDGADISSSTTAAIHFAAADEAQIALASGSANSLSDTSAYADDAEAGAALSSSTDLLIWGDGSLTVTGNANDAIASSDGLTIDSGSITVDAVDDGIRGKDYLVIQGGDVTVTAGGDGLKADNEDEETRGFIAITAGIVVVDAAGDGVQAETDLVVSGGSLAVVSGGGAAVLADPDVSSKGLKSGDFTVLEGASMTVDSSDDAVHSDGAIHLASGDITLATGDDGFHAEGTAYISDGTLLITQSAEGIEGQAVTISGGFIDVTASDDGINVSSADAPVDEEADRAAAEAEQAVASTNKLLITGGEILIDSGSDGIDVNGVARIEGGTIVVTGTTDSRNGALDTDSTFTISGGTLLAAGSSAMAEAPDAESEQATVSFTFDTDLPADTVVTLVDSAGNAVAAFTTLKTTQSIVFSSDVVVAGASYDAYTDGTVGDIILGGFAHAGDYSVATLVSTAIGGEDPAGSVSGDRSGARSGTSSGTDADDRPERRAPGGDEPTDR